MAHYLELGPRKIADDPLVLIVPGINNSNRYHWQTRWGRQRGDCARVDLGMWDDPHRNTWACGMIRTATPG